MKKKLFLCLSLALALCLMLAPVGAYALEEQTASSTSDAEETGKESATLGESVAAFIEENADTLLGALTLVSSLLVAFLYKSGLLPLLRRALSALSETSGRTEELTERFTERAEKELALLRESATPVAELLKTTEETVAKIEEALRASEEANRETRDILETETTLFYELLVSANLPEAQKTSMAESYYRLRERLNRK